MITLYAYEGAMRAMTIRPWFVENKDISNPLAPGDAVRIHETFGRIPDIVGIVLEIRNGGPFQECLVKI